MSSNGNDLGGARRAMAALALAAALVFAPAPAFASKAHSSAADRQRFVSIARSHEQAPLAASKADLAWAVKWLIDAPDVSVSVCNDPLGSGGREPYPYAAEIVFQNMFSMGAFAIEHPEAAGDAQQMAGVEGALNAYRSILKEKPDARSPDLDALLEAQSRGELPDAVRRASVQCGSH